VDLAESQLEGAAQQQQNVTRPKSAKQLSREQWREKKRESKREYILEDQSSRHCFEGRSETSQTARKYCILMMNDENNEFVYIPVNDDWVQFRARVSNKKLVSAEKAEKDMKKQEQLMNSRMNLVRDEKYREDEEDSAARLQTARPKIRVKRSDEDMGSDSEREEIDFEGQLEDDEEYIEGESEAVQHFDISQLKDLFSDSDSEEEDDGLSASGRDMKRILDQDRNRGKDQIVKQEEPESTKEISKSSEEISSDEEQKKKARVRSKKSEKIKATTSAATPTSGTKRSSTEASAERSSKKIKIENVEDPAALKEECLRLFRENRRILVKDFLEVYLKDVKDKQKKKERMESLASIFKECKIVPEKSGDAKYLVYKGQ
jgi:hypothetical protein